MIDQTQIKAQLERTRVHLKKHRNLYMVGAASLTVGVLVGATIVKTGGNISVKGDVTGDVISVTGHHNTVNKIVVELIENSTPSKPVHLLGTNLYFNSISEAARETGLDRIAISRNIAGTIPDVKGSVFKLLELAE